MDPGTTCEKKGFLRYRLGTVQNAQGNDNYMMKKGFSYWNVYAEDSNNGFTECVLEQQCNELCYYLYRHRYNITQGIQWKLCEVQFC